MDWWARLVGGASAPKKQAPKSTINDPQIRLARFKRVYHTILQLCNRPRNLANEGPILEQLNGCLERVISLLREETRAPAPHLSLQFAASSQIYTVIARAAAVSEHEHIIRSTVAVFETLIDSEEEGFLSSAPFAKSLMRLVSKVVDSGTVLISIDTETAILELLFTISAKIRLQPEILSVWFQTSTKTELEDVFSGKDKNNFVGFTQKDDFPLCYILIDRVHHDGRIGDFARTGLLYIFEATGRSSELEDWVVSSDLPTLMASGLGALYSQLSRELSILHPDATLPAVLAMSDYSTTHPKATAESAFSERHQSHMTTFLSYLAFWQDILDHCRSGDVKQTLLDHFQILFLQQLLYPSLLQSSDTDAGSSVAVLSYLTVMLESLDYPDLMRMILAYLLAIPDESSAALSAPGSPTATAKTPRSPSTHKRRQSLMLLTGPTNADDAVDPDLFNLVDLILNNISSNNGQSAYAALRLASTIITRQKAYALQTLVKVEYRQAPHVRRTAGALEVEIEALSELGMSFHDHAGLDEAFAGLVEDVRLSVESQIAATLSEKAGEAEATSVGCYSVSPRDPFLKHLTDLLGTFFTNSVDVNLALTYAIISIALCVDIRLDGWLAIDPSNYIFADKGENKQPTRSWQEYLDGEEEQAFAKAKQAFERPNWPEGSPPVLYACVNALSQELDAVRTSVHNLDQLISARKTMLEAANIDGPLISSDPPSLVNSPTQASFPDGPRPSRGHSRASSRSSLAAGRNKMPNAPSPLSIGSQPPPGSESAAKNGDGSLQPGALTKSIFQPPPPETPSTTDVLMQQIPFRAEQTGAEATGQEGSKERTASLNHVLTNIVVLQEFVLELVAVLQVRAAVLGEKEVQIA